MPFGPANLVHTDEAALAESTTSQIGSGSSEPGTRSSAGEHSLHTRRVAGSIPAASTTRPRRPKTANYLYFVQARTLRLIKIGIATCYNSRLSSLQSSSPDRLDLLGLLRPDGRDPLQIEQQLHVQFDHHRSHGEWFQPGVDLLAYIADHAISELQNQYELAQQAMNILAGSDDYRPWTPEMEAFYALPGGAQPNRPAGPKVDPRRPVVPEDAPRGNSRKAIKARYLMARGLEA